MKEWIDGFDSRGRRLNIDAAVGIEDVAGGWTSRDGIAGWGDALKVASVKPFDLVITDVNMPIKDGITLVRDLRGLGTYKFTPILVLTTEVDASKKKAAKAAGATGWLVKPFNPDELLATIRKVVG